MAGSAFLLEHERPGPSAGAKLPPTPDPRRHSMICCCRLCEQQDTGEQAMRSARGDYGQFLASIRSAATSADEPTATALTQYRKPSRTGDTPMRRREPARVLGPYQEEQLWRIIEVDARGRRKSYTADSRQAANRLMARLRANLGARTVSATIELWVAARLRTGEAAPATVADQAARVRDMLAPVRDLRLGDVTERKAIALYERATTEPSPKTGLPLRAASHRYYLSLVQRMWQWAQKQGYAPHNPWEEVEPIGRVSAGKPQLRPTEARRFAAFAEQEAAAGSDLALAALCCLSLGLRASEALGLTARDIDAEVGDVYVSGTKTAAARRRLRVPAHLATLLGRAAAARHPMDRLCVATRQTLHKTVVAMCARVGVPRVCVHGLRGTHASLAVSGGASVEAVARVLGHTSTKMTLGHYITEEAATAARVAAVDANLASPNHSVPHFGQNPPTSGPTGNSLLPMSRCRRAAARIVPGRCAAPGQPTQAPPSSERPLAPSPDPRLHSVVCCCLLCEHSATGEQAMRSVDGDYERFLAQVAASRPPAVSQAATAANLPAIVRTRPRGTHGHRLPRGRR